MKANFVKNKKGFAAIALSTIIVLTGCGASATADTSGTVVQVESTETTTTETTTETATETAQQSGETTVTAVETAATNSTITALLQEKIEYDASDEYTAWKQGTYTTVKLSGSSATITGSGVAIQNGVLTISKAGTYVLSGTFNGRVLVSAASTDDVRIVLNGVTITSTKSAPIEVYQANQVMLSLEKGTTNTITDAKFGTVTNADGDEITAAIFSKDDLIINGEGKLIVNAKNNDGITSRDDLLLISGNIQVTSVDDGIVGKDSVQIKNANITVTATGDAIKASNDTDAGEGYLLITGGTVTVTAAGDDALKGEQQLIISGGTVNIKKSVEAIESMDVILAGGTINAVSSDDAINAAGKTSGNTLSILGGNITVNAQGDGLDVNGTINMSGGTVTVYGPTNGGNGSLDYDQAFNITGGTLNIAGSAGMAQTPSQSSTQGVISMTFSSVQQAGSTVSLKDASGKVIATMTSSKNFQNVIFSNANIKAGQTYTVVLNNKTVVSITTTGTVTSANESGVVQGNFGGPGGGGKGGQVPPGGFK